MTTLTAPEYPSTRPAALEFADQLGPVLMDVAVVIDCQHVEAAAPSFVDELVKAIVVERSAGRLCFTNVPRRTAQYARRSAERRGVADRVVVEERLAV